MKKITLTFLALPLFLLGQVSISAENAYEIKSYAYNLPSLSSEFDEVITVPAGETWYIASNSGSSSGTVISVITSNNPMTNEQFTSAPTTGLPWGLWTEGTTIGIKSGINCTSCPRISYVVYKFNNSDITLATNFNTQPNNSRIFVYPNPTPQVLAFNSEKTFNITVFDLAGNKLMETQGNTINLEQLSNATYIVKAVDSSNKEVLSYKVVKE